MILSTLDQIGRLYLLERGLPIHYYAECLFHSSSCLRELTFDTLKIINAANLPVSDTGTINLPEDYVDDLALCIQTGGELSRLPKQDWITPLRLHDATTGSFVPYTVDTDDENQETIFGFPAAWSWFWNVNDWGEPTGRFFGAQGGTNQGYKVIKERRQIQLTDNFIGSTNMVLLYISSGQSTASATQIDVMAIRCIQSYIDWKRSPNAAIKDSYEAATFYNEKRLLRARLDDLTGIDIKNILRNNFSASIKN